MKTEITNVVIGELSSEKQSRSTSRKNSLKELLSMKREVISKDCIAVIPSQSTRWYCFRNGSMTVQYVKGDKTILKKINDESGTGHGFYTYCRVYGTSKTFPKHNIIAYAFGLMDGYNPDEHDLQYEVCHNLDGSFGGTDAVDNLSFDNHRFNMMQHIINDWRIKSGKKPVAITRDNYEELMNKEINI